jgi:AraC-like DNA-binding protein
MPRFHHMGRLTKPLHRSRSHSHDFWEICCYTRGEGVATIGGHRVQFAAGTIICYPPVIPHHEDSPRGCLELYTRLDRFDGRGTAVPVFQDSAEQPVQRLFELIHHEQQTREPGWEATTRQLFDVAIGYLERWQRREHPSQVEELKGVLQAHVDDAGFSITAAMDALPVSRDHLRRRFIAATGRTPLDYLTDLRIARAQQLLASGSFSIKDVATRAGFADPHYFSRLFRRRTGMTASEHRRHSD